MRPGKLAGVSDRLPETPPAALALAVAPPSHGASPSRVVIASHTRSTGTENERRKRKVLRRQRTGRRSAKQTPDAGRRWSVIEEMVFEAIAAVGLGWLAYAGLRPRSVTPSLRVWTAQLRRRHRREVRAIVALAREHDARHAKGSVQAFTARETLRSYLPETLAAYLAVPKALRRVRRARGLSPDEELSRQLRTLRHGLEQVQQSDAEAAASRMAENGAFLHERFGVPPPPAPPSRSALAGELGQIADTFGAYLRRI
jgi:hypothetical protein